MDTDVNTCCYGMIASGRAKWAPLRKKKALMRETKTMLTENLRTAIDKSIRS
ncbi:MAG: hypothetical protein ACJ72S_04165 [Nitrososphaeraceae archaeon]